MWADRLLVRGGCLVKAAAVLGRGVVVFTDDVYFHEQSDSVFTARPCFLSPGTPSVAVGLLRRRYAEDGDP